MAASTSAVGVSALYSSSFGGHVPSYQRSDRPYTVGGRSRGDRATPSAAQGGMPKSAKRLRATTCSASATDIWCNSSVASSSRSTSSRSNA
jgi:hypothetical protein